jgi:alanine dehydrogenase
MNIGIPKERRPFEYRVGLSPAGVEILCRAGNSCFVEHGAGLGAGFSDLDYERAGARTVYLMDEVFGRADLLVKVQRPIQEELEFLRPGSALAGYLLLASARQDKIDNLLNAKVTSIAFEQIQLADGSLPVLRPFSEVCGLMTAQIAARLLQSNLGGKGILLSGVPGVPPAEVVIIGAGVVGTNSARAFIGFGAHVTVLDNSMEALQKINDRYPSIVTMISTDRNIERVCSFADVVVGAVLIPGKRSPIVVPRSIVQKMKPRSVIIDVSIDMGGCFETSRPTNHENSTFIEEGVIHYCVPNIPGVIARTATHAYVNAVIPYLLELTSLGIEKAIENNKAIEAAVNTYHGELRHFSRLTGGGDLHGLE